MPENKNTIPHQTSGKNLKWGNSTDENVFPGIKSINAQINSASAKVNRLETRSESHTSLEIECQICFVSIFGNKSDVRIITHFQIYV